MALSRYCLARPFILTFALIVIASCGKQDPFGEGSELEATNLEWAATYDAYTKTAQEATEVFR